MQWELSIPLELQLGSQGSTRAVVGNLGFPLGLGGVLRVPLDLWWDLLSCCLGVTHVRQGFAGELLSCCNVWVAAH